MLTHRTLRPLSYRWLIAAVLPAVQAMPAQAADDLDELQLRLTDRWQLIRNDKVDDIRAWARVEAGRRFRTFRVETVLRTPGHDLASRFADPAQYPRWYWSVREATMLRSDAPGDFFLHLVHDAPYAMPDRDVVLHVRLTPGATAGDESRLDVESVSDILPPAPPLIRMPAENIRLRWIELANGQTKVTAEGYADPGGKVPFWAANIAQRSAPYQLIVRLRQWTDQSALSHAESP